MLNVFYFYHTLRTWQLLKRKNELVFYLFLYHMNHNFTTEYGQSDFGLQRLKICLFQFQLSSIRL